MNAFLTTSMAEPEPPSTADRVGRDVLVTDAQAGATLINETMADWGMETGTAAVPQRTKVCRVVRVPVRTGQRPHAQVLQSWEGVVLRITEDSFWARLMDHTHRGPDEEAEIPLEEISPGDLELVREGAVFYWTIACHETGNPVGQRTKTSMIRFRRLPPWTAHELEQAQMEGAGLRKELGWS